MFIPVGKIAKRTVWRSVFMLIRRSKYSAIFSKIHSYRQLFRRFCPKNTLLQTAFSAILPTGMFKLGCVMLIH